MRQVLAYVQKVFRLHDLATQVADSRYRRRIPVSSVILAWVYGFMTMVRSTEQLGRLLDRRRCRQPPHNWIKFPRVLQESILTLHGSPAIISLLTIVEMCRIGGRQDEINGYREES